MMVTDKPCLSQRWLMVIFITLSSALIFVLRYNMSVVIVAMVDPIGHVNANANQTGSHLTHVPTHNTSQSPSSDPIPDGSNAMVQQALRAQSYMMADTSLSAAIWLQSRLESTGDARLVRKPIDSNDTSITIKPVRTFDWDETTQGQILSSYFYGYLTFQVTGGRLCEKMGPKWVLASGTVIPGLLTFLTPISAYLGETYLIINRVVIGAFHALVLSSCYAFAAIWMPEREKSTAVIWINIGFEFGGFITLMLSGYISSQPQLGWECAFYAVGLMPLLWFIPYIFCVYSTPESHPRLSNYERKLLENSKIAARSCQEFNKRVKRIPPKFRWSTLLTSKHVWTSVIAKVTGYFSAYLLATKLPAYMNEVHGLPLGNNGFFCALTFLGTVVAKLICLKLAPWIEKKKCLSTTNQRKLFQCTSQIVTGSCLLAVNWFAYDVNVALTFIVITMMAIGMQCAGEASFLTDFAQDLSGTVFGFANTFTCFNGIMAPILTGKILEFVGEPVLGWSIVFYITSAICFLGAILFALMADSTPQQWAMTTYVEETGSIVKPPRFESEDSSESV